MPGSEAPQVNQLDGRAAAALWGAPFLYGLALLVLGALAIVFAGVASLASVIAFGLLLGIAGIVEIAHAFPGHRRGGSLLPLLSGLLSLAVGIVLFARPGIGVVASGLLISGWLLAMGLFRGVTSLMDRYARWGWDFVYGALSVILGIALLKQWPLSSIWLLGTLVGVEMVMRGFAVMGVSLAIRRADREATGAAH